MIIRVLGSAAGGGFPQWNCNCRNCASVRAGKPGFRARTQCSLAVSANGRDWVLLNAAPDLRQQINDTPDLGAYANGKLRNSPIKAVVVTGGDVDFVAGLLNLRELQPLVVYGSSRVLATLAANSIFNVLDKSVVARRELPFDKPIAIEGADGPTGLDGRGLRRPRQDRALSRGATAGAEGLRQPRGRHHRPQGQRAGHRALFFYIPGCAELDAPLAARLKGAPPRLLRRHALHRRRDDPPGPDAEDRRPHGPHVHLGPCGLDRRLQGSRRRAARSTSTSTIRTPCSTRTRPSARATEASGWEVGYDGMEIRL